MLAWGKQALFSKKYKKSLKEVVIGLDFIVLFFSNIISSMHSQSFRFDVLEVGITFYEQVSAKTT